VKRFLLVLAAAILLFGAGAAGLVVWLTRDPSPAGIAGAARAAAGPPAPPAEVELPRDPVERDRAIETSAERRLFEDLRRGFGAEARSPGSEARLLPALDVLFPKGAPRWKLECRRLVCRLDVDAPAAGWRRAFTQNRLVRQQVDRAAFDPDGSGLAFAELVEAKVAAGPARPEGERVLDDLERGLLASEAARACVAEGPAPEGADVLLVVDRSGVTYRFGSAVDPRVAHCLMMQVMPDVMATASAPPGVQRAERTVRLPHGR
jgi:hypothetical protein